MLLDQTVFRQEYEFVEENPVVETLKWRVFRGRKVSTNTACFVKVSKFIEEDVIEFGSDQHALLDIALRKCLQKFNELLTEYVLQGKFTPHLYAASWSFLRTFTSQKKECVDIRRLEAIEECDVEITRRITSYNQMHGLSPGEFNMIASTILELINLGEKASIPYLLGTFHPDTIVVGPENQIQLLDLSTINYVKIDQNLHPDVVAMPSEAVPLATMIQNSKFSAALTLLQIGSVAKRKKIDKIRRMYFKNPDPALQAQVEDVSKKKLAKRINKLIDNVKVPAYESVIQRLLQNDHSSDIINLISV